MVRTSSGLSGAGGAIGGASLTSMTSVVRRESSLADIVGQCRLVGRFTALPLVLVHVGCNIVLRGQRPPRWNRHIAPVLEGKFLSRQTSALHGCIREGYHRVSVSGIFGLAGSRALRRLWETHPRKSPVGQTWSLSGSSRLIRCGSSSSTIDELLRHFRIIFEEGGQAVLFGRPILLAPASLLLDFSSCGPSPWPVPFPQSALRLNIDFANG